MIAPAQWIKRNMLGTYSEELGRPLTEAEVRVQRCLEQLPIPDWYQKYSRPSRILKNCTPFECRPASWRTYKGKSANTPRKTPKKRGSPKNSPRKSPQKSESESSRTSTADSGFNETYRGTRKAPKKDKNSSLSTSPSTSGTDSDSPKIEDIMATFNTSKTYRSPLNTSHSFPRISRSRKIQNINIVFPKPFPDENTISSQASPSSTSLPSSSTPKTNYTTTKNISMCQDANSTVDTIDTSSQHDTTHTSFFIAEVEPNGVTTQVRVFAGPTDSSSSSDDEPSARGTPSPHTRFFNSVKKSTALENIVQKKRTDPGTSRNGSLIQDIIGELDRSIAASSQKSNCYDDGMFGSAAGSFVKSMVSALEQSRNSTSEEEEEVEEDRQSNGSSDSDLAKSTSISFKSSDDSSDEQPTTPLPTLTSEESSDDGPEEGDIYWIRSKVIRELPRTSSLLSMMSKGSQPSGRFSNNSARGRNSPGLSPIKRERREAWLLKQNQQNQQTRTWGLTYSAKVEQRTSRQLFRIDETGVLDSGYSDRSGATSSRTPTLTSERASTRRSSPMSVSSSLSSSPTLVQSCESLGESKLLSRSGPYVLKSFLV